MEGRHYPVESDCFALVFSCYYFLMLRCECVGAGSGRLARLLDLCDVVVRYGDAWYGGAVDTL